MVWRLGKDHAIALRSDKIDRRRHRRRHYNRNRQPKEGFAAPHLAERIRDEIAARTGEVLDVYQCWCTEWHLGHPARPENWSWATALELHDLLGARVAGTMRAENTGNARQRRDRLKNRFRATLRKRGWDEAKRATRAADATPDEEGTAVDDLDQAQDSDA